MHHSSLQGSRFICYYKRKQHNITSGSILEVPVTQNGFSFIYSFVSFSCFKPTSWLVLYYLRSRSTVLTYEDYVYAEKLSPRYSSFPLFLSLCTKGLRANLRSINFTFVICISEYISEWFVLRWWRKCYKRQEHLPPYRIWNCSRILFDIVHQWCKVDQAAFSNEELYSWMEHRSSTTKLYEKKTKRLSRSFCLHSS